MSSIANHDTVMKSIFNYMKETNIPNINKRSNDVFKNSVVDKYWFDKINNYFKSLDLDACCYKTYSNKINWKSRYIDIEDSRLKNLDKNKRDYINTLVKQYSSEELVFAMHPECYIFPELWLQDNSYQKIDLSDEFVGNFLNTKTYGDYFANEFHLIFYCDWSKGTMWSNVNNFFNGNTGDEIDLLVFMREQFRHKTQNI